MPEQLISQSPDQRAQFEATTQHIQAEQLNAAVFGEHLDTMHAIPEVEENREGITKAARELTEKFAIETSLAEDPAKMTVFTAIASRWSKTGDADTAERTFLADSLALVAHNNSPVLKEVYDQATTEAAGYNDNYQEAVLKQYMNLPMTRELKTAIDGGLLDAVKERLGVTADNEDPYEVIVLSISDSYATRGMTSDGTNLPERVDYAEESAYQEAMGHFNELVGLKGDVHKWRKGLEARGQQFMQDCGMNAVPMAWKIELNGATYLCMPQPFVEKVLHPDQFVTELKDNGYDQNGWEADFAILEHEYTHTQGGLNIDDGLAGMNLEELRAEHFSGNKNGYGDIKSFASDVGVITGTHLASYIKEGQKGGSSNEVFQDIAQNVGLEAMLDVVMVKPSAYVRAAQNELVKSTDAHLGSFEGVITRLLEREVQQHGDRAVTERVDTRLAILADTNVDMRQYLGYQRSSGLTVLSDLFEKRAIELGYIVPEAA